MKFSNDQSGGSAREPSAMAAVPAGAGAAGDSDPAAGLDHVTRDFYLKSMSVLDGAGVPYLVGGAYALAHYAGIVRHTKDLDLFVRHSDLPKVFEAYTRAGYLTERTHPHWLAKAVCPGAPAADPSKGPDAFIDLIYGSGNGLCPVDNEWLAHAIDGRVLGRTAKLCPPEEIIWTKCFIQERERFDGADVAHMILARGDRLNWRRLLDRFGRHAPALLGHLIFFHYIYPSARDRVPRWVMDELTARLSEQPPATENGRRLCYGTFFSWEQYLPDVHGGTFEDARIQPAGPLSPAQVERWTKAEK